MLPTFNIPPIGPRQGKVWGTTQLIFAGENVECHYISAKQGGYSSEHQHVSKWNRFFVISGSITVRIFHADGTIDETVVTAGQTTDVPPGIKHQFEALEDSVAIELYWSFLDALDIDRNGTQGGVR